MTALALGITDDLLARAQQVADPLSADAWELLTGRAAQRNHAPRQRISAGGATRLFRAADGWCALTLSRDDDVAAVPALLEADDCAPDPWPLIERWAAVRSTADVVARAVLLDLPVAALGEADATAPRVIGCGTAGPARPLTGLLVVDLTSMWAGPLCAHLLARAGATVVKVESPTRPDGTRAGDRAFFDWLNGGKLSYRADFDHDHDVLARLLSAADVVLEGSRPDALARRGLGPHDIPPRPGRVWVQITGHGSDEQHRRRVAFGDDAAVAGGLVGRDAAGPVFLGDAIADPLTGLTAAAEVLDAVQRGGGVLVQIAMAAVAATFAPSAAGRLATRTPQDPRVKARAPELGAHQADVDHLVAQRIGAPC